MILDINKTTACFITMIKHGVFAKAVVNEEIEKEVLWNWLMLCQSLPDSCEAEIFNTEKMKDDKSVQGHQYKMGCFSLLDKPVYTWSFDREGIIFCPIATTSDETFEEWKDTYIYDLRVQTSLSYILYILKKYGDVSGNII